MSCEAVENLSSQQRLVAQMLSVAYLPTTPAALARYLRETGLDHLTTEHAKLILSQLLDAGIVVRASGKFSCCSEKVEPLTRQAARQGILQRLSHPFSVSAKPRYVRHDEAMRDLRLAVHSHDEERFFALLQSYPKTWLSKYRPYLYVQMALQPFDAAWLEALPEGIREEFCRLVAVREEDEQTRLFLDWLERRLHSGEAKRVESTCLTLAWRALKQGRLVDAEELSQDLELPGGLALKGMLNFVRGDITKAVRCFDQGLAELRKATRRKKETFDSEFGVFHVLALLGQQQPESAAGLVQCAVATKGHPQARCYRTLAIALRLARGEEVGNKGLPTVSTRGGVVTLLDAAVNIWQRGEVLPSLRTKLEAHHESARNTGDHWLAAEFAELLGVGNPEWKEKACMAHRCLGTTTVLNVIPRVEAWQRTLKALEEFRGPLSGPAPSSHDVRMIWTVELGGWGVAVYPREQKLSNKGWSGGRPVALKRLMEDWKDMMHLSPADQAICEEIESYRSGSYGNIDYVLDGDKAVCHLIGHPLVFLHDQPAVQLRVVAGVPKLMGHVEPEGYRV